MALDSPTVLLLHGGEPSPQLLAVQRMAELFGARCLREPGLERASSSVDSGAACAVVDVASLGTQGGSSGRTVPGEGILGLTMPTLLLVTEGRSCEARLSQWTGGVVTVGEGSGADTCIHFPQSSARFTGELASTSFTRQGAAPLRLIADPRASSLMTVGEWPSFVEWDVRGIECYVWATRSVMDVSTVVGVELDFEQSLDTCLPLIIFLRCALGDACWHNPEHLAGFVIDDPLLVRRYGFIDFSALLRSAREKCYHVSLAFIPWNGWRMRRGPSRIFRDYADVFSLCVHGCDHNNNEYGQADYDLLRDKNDRALDRMDRLSQRVGIPYAPLAVCPQEQCSEEGWKAFADTPAFLGMVNTGCVARNVRNERVTMGDLLLPAQDALFGFPVFKRHYPGDFSVFALALFLGKPAILVEHHDYFRAGLGAIEEFVARLREQCPTVRWLSLLETATMTHMRRDVSQDCRAVRFFTNTFELHPRVERPMRWLLQKRVQAQPIASVTVDDMPQPFRVKDGFVQFELHTSSASRRIIKVQPVLEQNARRSTSPAYHARVAARRALSEFRDTVLARNARALYIAKAITRRLGVSAGRRTA
jgi:hypothetical protein